MRRALAGLGLAASLPLLGGCTIIQAAEPTPELVSATWEPYQALPNFDGSPASQDDPVQLERLRAVLDEHGVHGDVAMNETGCAGQLTIDLEVTFADGRTWSIARDTCQDMDPLAADLRALLGEWDPRIDR